ncbi:MAG: glutamate--tRNA ligase [Candidatus Liptonbacteria bacterium]|nr:glutamate--tRNA ligase [Candidatus Liptonbacteria bacterium]
MTPHPKKTVRVRLAPSPTGPLHLGTARTGLFNWLFARQQGGKFILRIEDTDQERSEKRYEEGIMEGLLWLGLDWDEGPRFTKHESRSMNHEYIGDYGPYRQSERTEIYKKYLQKLLDDGRAYYCYCTKEELEAQRQAMMAEGLPPKYSGHCRNHPEPKGKLPQVIRFLTPETRIEFTDLVRGKVSFESSLFGDMVVAKNLETPLYNFAAVIDDEEMKISHVIRGEDHLSNTPKQILLAKALGFEPPVFGHLPLILAADRSKLSKRYADTSLLDYREKGYLPEAVVNFMVLLGWHPKSSPSQILSDKTRESEQEVFSREELLKEFDLGRVQKAGAVFSQSKLDWLNGEHIKSMEPKKLYAYLKPQLEASGIEAPPEFLEKVIAAERERLKTLNDFLTAAGFFFELPDYENKLLKWKDETLPEVKMNLTKVLEVIEKVSAANFEQEKIRDALLPLSELGDRGLFFWPFRVALSGRAASPDPLLIAEVLGKEETIRRLNLAIEKIEGVRENYYEQTG